MSWKTSRQSVLSASSAVHEKTKSVKPHNLPTVKRGGGLRVGRVVSEEERRVQDELIEMLTTKLANKEKEVEMLRCRQNTIDREFAEYDRQLRQQQQEHARIASEITTTNQELHRQVQHLQIQCERVVESETQHTAVLEQKRLREKDLAQARLESRTQQQIVNELRREREQSINERYVLESKLQQVLQDQQGQITSTLKTASSRAADVEKKKNELSRVEDQLTEQLAALKKENLELKARRGQMSSQTKHLQARVAALENANATQEQKLEDAAMELETARKYCRDCQFRTKQLQEEIVFLKNRKVAPAQTTTKTAANSSTLAPADNISRNADAKHRESPNTDADDVPCWMKG
ncbi:unnamed protein product [Phytophthora fragariaefolia]|uniref:Unnamed protein product n=1 Tax=Phytophthora fragariaefolia TaxID=1490495 RepID=A0A9W6XKT4_9STRA|nr:unnamed protein product [Phytophthora fragariaefolia]